MQDMTVPNVANVGWSIHLPDKLQLPQDNPVG